MEKMSPMDSDRARATAVSPLGGGVGMGTSGQRPVASAYTSWGSARLASAFRMNWAASW